MCIILKWRLCLSVTGDTHHRNTHLHKLTLAAADHGLCCLIKSGKCGYSEWKWKYCFSSFFSHSNLQSGFEQSFLKTSSLWVSSQSPNSDAGWKSSQPLWENKQITQSKCRTTWPNNLTWVSESQVSEGPYSGRPWVVDFLLESVMTNGHRAFRSNTDVESMASQDLPRWLLEKPNICPSRGSPCSFYKHRRLYP